MTFEYTPPNTTHVYTKTINLSIKNYNNYKEKLYSYYGNRVFFNYTKRNLIIAFDNESDSTLFKLMFADDELLVDEIELSQAQMILAQIRTGAITNSSKLFPITTNPLTEICKKP